jgi:ribose/xylose/arabinose/galactoside ABC-type transport system permease subunit
VSTLSHAVGRVRPAVARLPLNNIGLIISLIGLCALFSAESQYFFTTDNGLNIGRAIAFTGIAAAVTTLVLVGGGLDLSIGSVMALVGVVAARLLSSSTPLWLTLLACLGVGIASGLVNGVIVTYVGVNPFIVTIGTQFVFRGLAYALSLVSGGELSITDKGFLYIGQRKLWGIPFSIYLLVGTLLVVHWVLQRTRFGRHVYAIGGNESAARLAGVPVSLRRMQIYVLSGVGSAFGGVVLASYTGGGVAYTAEDVPLRVIGAVILGGTALMGGRGTIFGTVLGIAILGVVANGITLVGLENYWQLIVSGSVLLLAVVIDEVRAKRRAR